jgi:hypothetical protein
MNLKRIYRLLWTWRVPLVISRRPPVEDNDERPVVCYSGPGAYV